MEYRRRYEIFISSTFDELKEQRKQAKRAIIEKKHMPVALDDFSPSNQADLEVIIQAVKSCQAMVLILGSRYGTSIGKDNFKYLQINYPDIDILDESISFTELEYILAKKFGLEIYVFMQHKDEVKESLGSLDENVERLINFYKGVKQFKRMWHSDEHFDFIVANAISDELDKSNKPGFILEIDDQTKGLVEIASRNKFIVDIVKKLGSFTKLDFRMGQEAPKKRAVGEMFKYEFWHLIRESGVSLFFESGSTLAYLSEVLAKELKIHAVPQRINQEPNNRLLTNNIAVLLNFMLNHGVPCGYFPWSPPVEPYGASYGKINYLEDQYPDYELPVLGELANNVLKDLSYTDYSISALKRPALLLGAISGIQLTDDYKIKWPEDGNYSQESKDKQKTIIEKCKGPHTGSYYNKLFKRYMYGTQIPTILFFHDTKIDCEIEIGKCHFIFDAKAEEGGIRWIDFVARYPLAMIIGCGVNSIDRYQQYLEELGFDVKISNKPEYPKALLAQNDQFKIEIEKIRLADKLSQYHGEERRTDCRFEPTVKEAHMNYDDHKHIVSLIDVSINGLRIGNIKPIPELKEETMHLSIPLFGQEFDMRLKATMSRMENIGGMFNRGYRIIEPSEHWRQFVSMCN